MLSAPSKATPWESLFPPLEEDAVLADLPKPPTEADRFWGRMLKGSYVFAFLCLFGRKLASGSRTLGLWLTTRVRHGLRETRDAFLAAGWAGRLQTAGIGLALLAGLAWSAACLPSLVRNAWATGNPPSNSDSEKAWSSGTSSNYLYPKATEAPLQQQTAVGPRGDLSSMGIFTNQGYRSTMKFDQRGPGGDRVDSPFSGSNMQTAWPVSGGADGVPRYVGLGYQNSQTLIYAGILTDDPTGVSSTRVQVPAPNYTQGDLSSGFWGSPAAASDANGNIHILWSNMDAYWTDSTHTDWYYTFRIFYAQLSPGDASDLSHLVPPQVVASEIAYTSPNFPQINYSSPLLSFQPSIAADANGVHALWAAVYYPQTFSNLHYEINHMARTTGWGSKDLLLGQDVPANYPKDFAQQVVGFNGIALKSDGTPACVYGDDLNNALLYAEASSGWAAETVATSTYQWPPGGVVGMDSKDRAYIGTSAMPAPVLLRRDSAGHYSARDLGQADGYGYDQALLSQNDRAWIGASSGGGYRFHVEDNLGTQDPYAMQALGPGAQFNTANGNLYFNLPLLQTQGRGFPLSFGLTYNSLETCEDLGLSQRWCHNNQIYLTDHFSGLELHRADGSRIMFTYTTYGYIPQDAYGDFDRIDEYTTLGDATYPWVMTDQFGVKYGFGLGFPTDDTNDNKLRRIRDLNGNELNLTYGDNPNTPGVTESNLLTATDSVGRQLKFTYTIINQIDHVDLVINSGIVRTWTFGYESTAAKRLLTVTDSAQGPEGSHVWTFNYYGQNDYAGRARTGLLKQVIPPKGANYAWTYGYQTDNRLAFAQDPLGNYVGLDYSDPTSGPFATHVTDRRGNIADVECDYVRSLATKITYPQTPSDASRPFIQRTFDPNSRNELTFTDARGNTTTKTYAATANPPYVKDNLESVHRPDNPATAKLAFTYTQDGFNRVASITAERKVADKAPVVTTMQYDGRGNLLKKIFPHASTDKVIPFETYVPDQYGRTTSFTDADTHTTTYTFDEAGDSGTGLVTSILRPDSPPEHYAYDARGNQTDFTSMAGGHTVYRFDLRDRLRGVTEPGTPEATMDYDLHDLLMTRTDARGNATTFTHDLLDRLDEERNPYWTSATPNLNRIKMGYDANGNPTSRTDFKDQATTTMFDERNRPVDEMSPDLSPNPRVETLTAYDGNSNVKRLTRRGAGSAPDQVTTFDYDGRNNQTFVHHPGAMDLEAPPTGALGMPAMAFHTDETRYDESDLPLLRIRRSGALFETASETVYNFRNLPQETREYLADPDGSNPGFISTFMAYDPATNLIARTDPDKRAWTFTFDGKNRPVSTFNASKVEVSRTVYNDAANTVETLVQDPTSTSKTAPLIRSVLKQFNLKGELAQTLDVNNQPTVYTHDENGNLKSTLDAEGNLVESAYDKLNRQTKSTTHPSPGTALVTVYTLDENGNRVDVEDPNHHHWLTDFDAINRPLKATNPSLTFRTLGYDPFSNLAQSADEGGQTHTISHDALNRPTQDVISGGAGGGQTLTYFHDGADRRTEEMAQNSASLHRWNPLSRQVAQEDFLVSGSSVTPLRSVSYTFSKAGDRTGMTSSDPAVGSWTYQYTQNHQLAKLQHLPSKESHTWKYTRGMLPSVHKMPNGAKETRTYDTKERLQRLQTLNGKNVLCDIAYTFNKVDLRKTITYHHLGGAVLSLDYDGTYRLVHEQLSGGTVPAYDLCYVFDGAGNRVAKFSGNSVVYSVFDVENRLTQETTATPTLAPSTVSVDSTASGYNAGAINDGNTADSVLPTQTWASANTPGQHFATLDLGSTALVIGRVKCFIPTGVGPLQRFKAQYWDGSAFQDLPGPHVSGASAVGSTGWFTNTAHEVDFDCVAVSTTQIRFLMDDGGGPASSSNQAYLNEFQALRIDQGTTKTLNYDPAGLLMGESDGSGMTNYGYDWGYRLASYQKGTASASYLTDVNGRRLSKTTSGGTELYAYDGEDVIADYSQVGSVLTLKARYTNGLGIDEKLTMARSGASYDFVPDALGSTQALVGKKGVVANRYFNDAWGNSVQKVEGVVNRFQYAGREFDSESGNYHNRARFYMPGRGAFGQRDPARSGLNWMAYGGGNPANATDPLGLENLVTLTGINTETKKARGALFKATTDILEEQGIADRLHQNVVLGSNVDLVVGATAGGVLEGLARTPGELANVPVDIASHIPLLGAVLTHTVGLVTHPFSFQAALNRESHARASEISSVFREELEDTNDKEGLWVVAHSQGTNLALQGLSGLFDQGVEAEGKHVRVVLIAPKVEPGLLRTVVSKAVSRGLDVEFLIVMGEHDPIYNQSLAETSKVFRQVASDYPDSVGLIVGESGRRPSAHFFDKILNSNTRGTKHLPTRDVVGGFLDEGLSGVYVLEK